MSWARLKKWANTYDIVLFLGFIGFGWLVLWIIYILFAMIFF